MPVRAAIIGIAGTSLAAEEAALFRRHRPAGAILFRRNVENPVQVAALCADLRQELGGDAPILIDQEGGRVARLRPPHWPEFPPAALFEHAASMAAEANATLLGMECAGLGLDVVCAPVLDLRLPGMHQIIGDRAFSAEAVEIARLGGAWVRGLQQAGCIPVVKHIPGHGRAEVDSHCSLPRVSADRATLTADFAPFRALSATDGGVGFWAMTAHILYTALDAVLPATLSPRIINQVVRGDIGFDGVLISDDLAMGAMAGLSNDLAGDSIAAGCDLALHCTGVLAETAALLAGCPKLSEAGVRRMAVARAGMLAARRQIAPEFLAEIRDRLLAARPVFSASVSA